MKYDIIIIGSGLGGLECGYILSRTGRRVLVLEKESQLGGCLQSYRRRELTFDTGFHYVGGLDEGQSLHAAFHYLGLLDLPWHRLDADGFDRVTVGERTFAFAQGYDAFVQRLAEDFPAERAALQRYTDLLKRSASQQFAVLNTDTDGFSFLYELMGASAWQYLTGNFRDPLLINVLSGTSLKMELRQESLPLFTFLHGNSSFIESSWRLRGDGSLIVKALAEGIRAQGGEIICNAKAQELVDRNGQLTHVVCSNGETYEGRFFISDIHPALTCQLVKQNSRMKPVYRNRLAGLENTFGMFTVSLSIRPNSLRYFNWNQYIYRQPNVWTFYQDNTPVGGILVSCRKPEDDSDYTRQVDLLTPMTWDKCKIWNDTQVGRRGSEYNTMKERMADECIILAEHFLPGLRNMSECYTSTPLTWHDYTFTPNGSAYGIRKDFRDPLMTMLSPRTPVPNLLLTGQNLMLHGLHGVTMTAFYTCAEVMGKEAVWKIIEPNK
ncbi:phytoene desaturase family protein [Parabacteroides bouchesdurhonensis]|uniref:phytoene desaturase family protein n=1 Tax=Parabacteroides bouchesdurhonensis TaxID=1936995 RepID=UPI000C82F66F|nr:NAD(P)/FAD-dependent oxidoreductase [Parabacteroides bouchesdurhonensis]